MMLKPTYDELFRENQRLRAESRQLRAENVALKRRMAELEAKVARLTAIIEDLRRQGKRQAAPFSKGAPKADPKKAGRKAGAAYGRKGHRRCQPIPHEFPGRRARLRRVQRRHLRASEHRRPQLLHAERLDE